MNLLEKLQENGVALQEKRRESIMALETEMKKHEQLEMPLTHHHFHKGYGRELFIPAGTLLVGKIHKHQTLNILLEGDISLLTEEGTKRVQAPFTVVSKPGIKRVGYAHTDCKWLTVHGTEETDLEKIEEEVIAKDYSEVEQLDEWEVKLIQEMKKE